MIAPSPTRAIERALEGHRGERHLIVLQDYPDPDAVASGMAHQALGRRHGIAADIAYAGAVSHHQNRALITTMDAQLLHVSKLPPLQSYDGAVFLDTQGATSQYLARLLAGARIPTLLIVDHHGRQSGLGSRHTVWLKSGATSTVYADCLRLGRLGFPASSREGRLLATALLLGILTDTNSLLFATREDRQAAEFLQRWCDPWLLRRILAAPLPPETSEILNRAVRTRYVSDSFAIAGVGYLAAEDRDAIPQAADSLLAVDAVSTAVVFGIVRDWRARESLVGSLRTANPAFDPDLFLKSALGSDFQGRHFGGGRPFAGGFEIPIGLSTRGETAAFQSVRWAYYDLQVTDRLLRAAKAFPPRLLTPSARQRQVPAEDPLEATRASGEGRPML